MKATFPESDTRPNQVGDTDTLPVTYPNLSDLIGWSQKILSTSWENLPLIMFLAAIRQ